MKKYVLSIAIMFLTAFVVNAQVSTSNSAAEEQRKKEAERKKLEQTQVTTNTNPNAPDIKFDKLVHDYGTVEQHGDGRCEFTFTNEGKEPLILSNVRSSCGCTVPEWPRQPILPGQSEVIKVKYDTKRVGVINKSVYVYSNAKESPVTLKIKGKVEAKSAQTMPEKKVEDTGAPVNK
jgi:hypothetical protein